MSMLSRRVLLAIATSVAFGASALAQDKSIVVASTTSTQDSGLFGHILPLFKAKTGIQVKVIAQGTGQALDTGRRGDADVVFVHAKSAEEQFLTEGEGVRRYPVMYNDFVLIGPKSDPADLKGTKDIVAALKAIKEKKINFISRGDRSGTHQAELNFWKVAGIDIATGEGALVQRYRTGHGGRIERGVGSRRLCAVGPRHLALVQEQGRSNDRGRRRQAPIQPVWRNACKPEEASHCEEGARTAIH